MRSAFIVIIEHPDGGVDAPCVGDVSWALRDSNFLGEEAKWKIHTTTLDHAMLARHKLP